MMISKVDWEWVVEHVDEHGDIQDCEYWDKLDDAKRDAASGPRDGCVKVDMGLSCSIWYDDGFMERGYAYIENGTLPENATDSHGRYVRKVPKRLASQLS
jgi:hypothetical protein